MRLQRNEKGSIVVVVNMILVKFYTFSIDMKNSLLLMSESIFATIINIKNKLQHKDTALT
jgi:hypothetical protein